MAIARGNHQVAESNGPTSISVTCPTASVGDVLVATVVHTNTTAVTPAESWTQRATVTNAAGESGYVWTRTVDGTEPGAFTFNGISGGCSAVIVAYSGVDTTSPIDVTPSTANSGGPSVVVPSLTTTNNGCMLFSAGFVDARSANTITAPASMGTIWTSTGTGRRTGVADESQATAGATGTRTWTSDGTLSMGGILLALRPSGGSSTPATVRNLWVGAPTTDGVTVSAQLQGDAATSVRLKVSTATDLSVSPVFSSAVTPTANKIAKMSVTGLAAGTTYYYGVEIDGVVDTVTTGQFKTAPSGASNFSFAIGSCMFSAVDGGTDSQAWARAKARNPDLCIVNGDLAYIDEGTNNQNSFRDVIDGQLANYPNMADMFATVPVVYVWSDHDFGQNDADGTSPSAPAAQAVFREKVPHFPLEESAAIYHTFVYGRVRFILTDERTYMDPFTDPDGATKTILGATQKQWLKDTITNATEPLICWIGDAEFIGTDPLDDGWASANTERDELATFINASGKNVVRFSGDTHCLAADDGTAIGFPCIVSAPWQREGDGVPVGTYSEGHYPPSSTGTIEQYGFVDITDDGTTLTLTWTGYDNTDTAQVTVTKSVTEVSLDPPTGITATAVGSTQIDLSWTAATGATGYDVERDGVVVSSNQVGTSFSDTGLTPNTAYTYRVRSVQA